jgi:Zn-dependent protease with chaperone function
LTLANLLVLAAGQLPYGVLITQPIREQIMTWVRCAEFTCDRAALLATQNPKIMMSVLMKLTGGSPSLVNQLNLDAFIAQARAYEDVSKTEIGDMLKQLQTAQLTHPVPVLRAREIDRWASSQDYQSLIEQRTMGYGAKPSKGGWRNW